MAEQIDPATGKRKRKRKGDRPESLDPSEYDMEASGEPRDIAPLPEQQAVPAGDTQYLNMTPDERTQENLRRSGLSPEEISQYNEGVANREPLQVRRQQPEMNMPPAPQQQQLPMSPAAGIEQQRMEASLAPPQGTGFGMGSVGLGPDMNMPPAPAPIPPASRQIPTNQFGQPERGVLIPERAPEDPNRVMEQFGRGSPEHIEALQAQMRTQQVARSRTEDMADPRLAHLPTREQYDMDLTRRRYGEEAIDRRAGELMGGAPLGRTEADAVRMAGREALDQRRQDRGMLSFEDRDKKREDIRMTQQEMFEDRRDARAARREDNRARKQLEDDARRAGMTVPEYQMKQAEIRALSAEERMLADQITAANREAGAGRTFEAEQAGLARTDAADQAKLARDAAAAESKLVRGDAADQAEAERGVRSKEIDQRMQQGDTANLIAQGTLTLNTAVHEYAKATNNKPLTPKEMTAMAQAAVQFDAELGIDSTIEQKMVDIANSQEMAFRVHEERQRRTDGRGGEMPAAGAPSGAGSTQDGGAPSWVPALSEIESGMRMSEADANRQKEELADMDRSVDSILELMKSDPEKAREQAARISQAMIEANPDIEQSEAAWFENDNTRMTAANRFAYLLMARVASGRDFAEDLSLYKDRLGTAYQGYKPRARRGQ